ncbi:Sodium:sulfate symporter transmembrane region family protein [Histomonas meleagridis]|uniref:Sodium:sulfate symporter transmembrane region family protein n=1 Tax=Histomonas meleagridis TaxID=135588 RepID=UPI00355A96A9|nr:Sodium:sulfate symporter transmembrane region family protein [Histomonas meleagridis]KAH0796643.1 Sodium:sulfate symporter transmembrane region family protein [Histomonas meleagridis]
MDEETLISQHENGSEEESSTEPRAPHKLNLRYVLTAIIIFLFLYILPILSSYPCAHTCFAILVTSCFLWITEAIPSFATAYLIPFLNVVFRTGVDQKTGERIPASELAQVYTSCFMNPIIFVFLSSLVLSTALQKLNITTRISNFILGKVSPNPKTILLVLMFLNVGMGSLISNVASTTLTLSFSLPIIRRLNPDDPFIKAILFGIAWSGNCAGMPTTIASPQNVIASNIVNQSDKHISFIQWILFALPQSIFICFIEWLYLVKRFPEHPGNNVVIINGQWKKHEKWSNLQIQAIVITLITILLWSLGDKVGSIFGHIGISAMIPIIWFFSNGTLTLEDFNSIKWSTLVLLGGGLALGESMKISGLLDLIPKATEKILSGISLPFLIVTLLSLVGIFGSILSSTTAASILFPLIMAIGKSTGRPQLLVLLSTLMISGAQLFHISSFPNALVSGVCPETEPSLGEKKPFLSGSDYIRIGWPTLIIIVIIISIFGYSILSFLGF